MLIRPLFPPNPDGGPSSGLLLSDRSYEVGEPIGIPGRQRGNSKQKDQFVTAMFHLTFNLQSYKCPTAYYLKLTKRPGYISLTSAIIIIHEVVIFR